VADIFNSRPGVVQVIEAEQAIPARLRIGGFDPKAVLVSGVDYTQRTNQQFQYSLDRNVYIYVFGDLMGTLMVSGLAFPETCAGEDGIVEILEFYRQGRAAINPATVNVAIGNELIVGFMTEVRLRAMTGGYDAVAPTEEFHIGINALPRE